mmetsp:Transcript_53933/g.87313  ORF Transcript_53933/g.87313 Transcript_53933/m.87313 type:complete len:249 (+) Transcript_53933:93-839(+)
MSHVTQIVFGVVNLLGGLASFIPNADSGYVAWGSAILGLLVGTAALLGGCMYNPCNCCDMCDAPNNKHKVAYISCGAAGLGFIACIVVVAAIASVGNKYDVELVEYVCCPTGQFSDTPDCRTAWRYSNSELKICSDDNDDDDEEEDVDTKCRTAPCTSAGSSAGKSDCTVAPGADEDMTCSDGYDPIATGDKPTTSISSIIIFFLILNLIWSALTVSISAVAAVLTWQEYKALRTFDTSQGIQMQQMS